VRIYPGRGLLAAAAAWTALAAAAVVFAPLWPAVAGSAAVILALVVLDGGLLRGRPLLGLTRRLPEHAFLGRPVGLELVLRNASQSPVQAEVFDEWPRDLAASDPVFSSVTVGPAADLVLSATATPQVRGDRSLGCPVLLERSPLGLLRRRVLGPAAAALPVYPDTAALLRPEALDPKRALALLGVKPARRRGEGMEFESLRDYVPGDDPRRVDQAATARRGRPVVRLYQHERNHQLVIALDASRLMAGRFAGRTKLDYAVDAALALAYAALVSGDRVGLTLFDRDVLGFVPPRRRRRDLGEFVEMLRPLQPRIVEADFGALAAALTAGQRQRALVVILSDFVEADATRFMAPLAVLAKRHQVLLVAVRDRVFDNLDASPGERPGDSIDLYRRIVVDDLLHEREVALGRLRRQGLHTLDLPPASVTGPVLNRYLALRRAF
jgi:uncharacterized protein (DUF58 family)